MDVFIPYQIGDKIIADDKECEIKGLHIFIDKEAEVSNIRAHIGNGKYVTLYRKTKKRE